MRVDQRLNLVVPVELPDGSKVYVHSMPFSAEFFDEHFIVIAQTHASIYGDGFGAQAGPRIAAKLMRKFNETAAAAVMAEIRRTTFVILPDAQLLLDDAMGKGIIDKMDADILENALVFFTVISAMHKPKTLKAILETVCGLWDAQISSLSYTAFADSLRTSTGTAPTGGTAKGSSLPS